MPEKINSIPDIISGLPLVSRISRHTLFHGQSGLIQRWLQLISPVLLALVVGGGAGALAVIASYVPAKWTLAILIAAAAVPVALLVNDVRKLVLITFVVYAPLGIEIAIQNRGSHGGGPTGYLVSLATVALAIGYTHWIITRKPKPRFFPIVTVPALLYVFVTALSFFPSRDWQLSAFGLFFEFQVFLMYFYIVNHVTTWADLRLIVTTALVCLLVESSLMAFQYFTGVTLDIGNLVTTQAVAVGSGGVGVTGERVAGTLGTPASAALYLNSMLTLTFGAVLSGLLINTRLALSALFLGVVALIGTSSRGGWTAFIVATLLVLGRVVWTETGKKAIFIFLLGGLLFGIFFGRQILQRYETITNEKSRDEPAAMARNIIKAYPFGVGVNTYDLYMNDKYAAPAEVGHTHYTPHNQYLLVWSELGPQGLVVFLLLLIAPVWQAKCWLFRGDIAPRFVILAASLLGGLAAHVVHMVSESFSAGVPVYLFWFILAMLVAVNQLIASTALIATSTRSDESGRRFPSLQGDLRRRS